MVYKILNNQVIIPSSALHKAATNRPRKCTEPLVGTNNELSVRLSTLNNPGKTFFYCAPTLWNNKITPTQARAPSTEAFKNYFYKD